MIKAAIHISSIEPYKASIGAAMTERDRAEYIRLDWNESPYAPAPAVLDRIRLAQSLNLYPDVNATELRERLSIYTGISAECIRAYNGSDAALRDICLAYLDSGDNVLIKEPTYNQFHGFATMAGGICLPALGRTPFDSSLSHFPTVINSLPIKMVYIVNPNNPTGVVSDPQDIKRLVKSYPNTLFIIDEAYHEYIPDITLSPLVDTNSNVIITRSFSKAFCLAGLRIAYLMASPKIVTVLDKIRNGKEVNALAQIAAVAALDNIHYMRWVVRQTSDTKRWVLNQLNSLVETVDTPANFFLLKVKDVSKTLEAFREHKILLRDRSHLPQMEGFIRVTVGTSRQMERFVEVAQNIISKNGNEQT